MEYDGPGREALRVAHTTPITRAGVGEGEGVALRVLMDFWRALPNSLQILIPEATALAVAMGAGRKLAELELKSACKIKCPSSNVGVSLHTVLKAKRYLQKCSISEVDKKRGWLAIH